MKCRVERRGLRYQAVVVHEGRPSTTTRVTALTRKGAERILRAEGCTSLGGARRKRRRRR